MKQKQLHEKWVEVYRHHGAFWAHDGNKNRPHVELTSGNHSSGFLNSSFLVQNPRLLQEACDDLVLFAGEQGFDIKSAQKVAGPALGAVTIAYELARQLRIEMVFLEKVDGVQKLARSATFVKPGMVIVPSEDVITTRKSLLEGIAALEEKGAVVTPCALLLANRSDGEMVGERKIVSLIRQHLPMWTPAECPLCKDGSVALRPKGENWEKLNAAY
jgi:orotate phosphoribosyltransferase